MNTKRKIFEYQTRETRDDYSAYYDILAEHDKILDEILEGDYDSTKLKQFREMNQFLAENEPYEVEIIKIENIIKNQNAKSTFNQQEV